MNDPRRQNRLILILLFIAGFSGLVYEVVWARILTLTFGGTVFATSAVLCAFMGGLALGSWVSGRLVDGRRSPLLLLAGAQFLLGLCGIGLLPLFSLLTQFYVVVHRVLDPGLYALTCLRFSLSVLLLVVPAALIAAVFPVVSRLVITERNRVAQGVAVVYGVDTLGAVAGAVVAGFVLLPLMGVRSTVFFAAEINFLVGLVAYLMHRRSDESPTATVSPQQQEQAECSQPVLSSRATNLLLWMFALSGAAALCYEVLVIKAMVHLLSMHIHAVSTMLASFLFGLGAGSLACMALRGKRQPVLLWFALVEAGIGLMVFSMPLLFAWIPTAHLWLQEVLLPRRNLGLDYLVQPILCFLVILPPALLMGATLPLLVAAITSEVRRIGRSTGIIYAVNTLGGAGGVVVATFLVLPFLGFKAGMFIAGGINVLIAVVVLLCCTPQGTRFHRQVVPGIVVAAMLLLIVSANRSPPIESMFLAALPRFEDPKVCYFKEGPNGSVAVLLAKGPREGYSHQLLVNGNPEGGSDIASLRAFQLLGNLPFLLHEEQERPKSVLVLTFGMGITLGAAADQHSESIQCVDLAPEVFEASRCFSAYNHNVLDDPKVTVDVEDARNFLLTTEHQFDIIILDATHPAAGDSWMLYTRECYEQVKKVLAPNGVVAQWVPGHGMTPEAFLSVLNTVRSVFPHLTLWSPPDSSHAVLVGTPDTTVLDWAWICRNVTEPAIDRNLEEAEIFDAYGLLSFFIASESVLAKYSTGAALNTDDLSPVQFISQSVQSAEAEKTYVLFTSMKENPRPLMTNTEIEDRDSTAWEQKLEKLHQASILVRVGMTAAACAKMSRSSEENKSFTRQARKAFENALALNPDDRDSALVLQRARPLIRPKSSCECP